MDANEAQEEYEEVQSELRKKEEEVGFQLLQIAEQYEQCLFPWLNCIDRLLNSSKVVRQALLLPHRSMGLYKSLF